MMSHIFLIGVNHKFKLIDLHYVIHTTDTMPLPTAVDVLCAIIIIVVYLVMLVESIKAHTIFGMSD